MSEIEIRTQFDAHTFLLLFFQQILGEIPLVFGIELGKIDHPDLSLRPADWHTYQLVTFKLGPLTGEHWKVEVRMKSLGSGSKWEPDWIRVSVGELQSIYYARESHDPSHPYLFYWSSGPQLSNTSLHPRASTAR